MFNEPGQGVFRHALFFLLRKTDVQKLIIFYKLIFKIYIVYSV